MQPLFDRIDWVFGACTVLNGICAVVPPYDFGNAAAGFFSGTSLIFFLWSVRDNADRKLRNSAAQ